MSRVAELREIVAKYDLNNHPFYTEWRHGTLPIEKLEKYAEDYGHFVNLIADGWEQLGRSDYAQEEREHHILWGDFASAVGLKSQSAAGPKAALPETNALIDTVRTAFSAPASAIGGLYAFELQQPDTSQVKLDGLRDHYSIEASGEKYFEEHAGKWHEVESLDALIEAMADSDFARAKSACEAVASGMWHALDGIYGCKN
jgi:pyrroloquinoline quinone (PQQ) biosynthesis protein C